MPQPVFQYKCRKCGAFIIKNASGQWAGLATGSIYCYPNQPKYRKVRHAPK